MDKIRTILIDDEKSSLIILEKLLEKNVPEVEIIGKAQSVAEGIKIIDELKPDLVFLDISMPDGDGFEVLEKVDYKDFGIIFVTAYDQYAIKAFEFSALHYILKPVKAEELVEAVNRYKQSKSSASDIIEKLKYLNLNLGEKPTKLILPTSSGMHIIDFDDIIRCESSNNYTTFFLKDGKKIVVSKSIQTYEKLLKDSHFCRIHNKHIVNLKYIKKYVRGRGGYVVLANGEQIDVSEGRKKQFLEKLSHYTISS